MTINGFAKIDSSLINLNSDKNKPKNTTEIKNEVQEQPQTSSDSLSSTKLKSSKIIPANAVPLIKIEKKGSSTDNENYAKFTKLYDKIDKGILEKLSGDEVNASIEILNNDSLRKFTTPDQKTRLIKAISFYIESFKTLKPEMYKLSVDGINKAVADEKKAGRADLLMESIFVDLSNTGVMASNMDDWGARKIVETPELLKLTTPEQKVVLLYSLKIGYTEKKEEHGINKILKEAVDKGELKTVMSQWSNGLDVTSATFDSLYQNMSNTERRVFLELVNKGIDLECNDPSFIAKEYGANKILEDIVHLKSAQKLEKSGKYEEAASEYGKIKDNLKAKQMIEMAGYKNYKNSNYLGLVKNFVSHANYDAKTLINATGNSLLSGGGSIVANQMSSFAGEILIDHSFKNFPILQSKNIYEIKNERKKTLDKLDNIKTPVISEAQKKSDKISFEAKIDKLTGTKARENNSVSMFIDGEACFERLKTRIENSTKSIYMEAFLFHNDDKGKEIGDMLIKKAKQGLDVRVIVDSFSNTKEFPLYKKMRDAGVKVIKNKGSFDNVIESRGLSAYHRKLYIFDNKAALTGGANIGNEYLTKGKWHDMLVEVQGPVMSDTLNDFYKHWSFSSGDKLEKAPPPSSFNTKNDDLPKDIDGSKVRLLTTDPTDKKKSIKDWMLNAINNAKERILVQDPYFNDPETINALKEAIKRKVKVDIIFPNSNDVKIMQHLDDNTLDELYAAGANTYKYNTSGKESFNHLKATVVDDMVCLGSANKDVRAMNTNQEINYVIDDPNFTKQFVEKVWNKDKANSKFAEPTPENFVKRLVKFGFKSMPSLF